MAPKSDLYGKLCESRRSDDLGRGKYIPNNELLQIVARDSVVTELNEHRKRCSLGRWRHKTSSTDLANRILESGRKLFAILVNLGLPWGAKNLLDAGLTDEDLPLSRKGNQLTSSGVPSKNFEWPAEWEEQKLDYFVEKQWLVLAPVFRVQGAHRAFAPECPLPFETVDEARNGLYNVVYKASVHRYHQEGFEVEAPGLEVALKEFKSKDDFAVERSNLNKIRGLPLNKHITQHFETFSHGNKNYIIFPWAGGGDLDNFWKNKDEEARSPHLALWCLQQMLGLAEALETLHNQIGEQTNIRHGDLKPGNILHFLTGGPYGTLKIADFGISRVHDVGTLQRHGIATTTQATTPSYQAPEATFKDRPRSRKFDIWSIGCIFLEFTIWVVRDYRAVEKFKSERKPIVTGDGTLAHFYQKKDNGNAEIHPAVVDHIKGLRCMAQSGKDTAFGELVDIIELKLLRIEVEDRVGAETLCGLLRATLKRAQGDQAFLFKGSEV